MPFQLPFEISMVSMLDILVVALVFYKLIMLIKGTRAVQLLKGLAVLLILTAASNWLGLITFNWILRNIMTMVFVALPVVFQPELRRALEQIGRGKFFTKALGTLGEEEMNRLINEIVKAFQILSNKKIGALIVFERETGLEDYIETGVKIDGTVSAEFIVNIFIPNTPLHDGAVIIRGDRIAAAGCFLPLSDNPHLSKDLGTRHRAALGITELSDALSLVVSEETGVISLASDGKLNRFLDEKRLREFLEERLGQKVATAYSLWNWRQS